MHQKGIDVSIIIPFFNEEQNIAFLQSELNKFIAQYSAQSFEILFVDDGSADKSIEHLKESSFIAHSKLVKLSRNYGSHAALRAGILQSRGKYVTFVYADLQDPLELIIRMHNLCIKGAEIAWAERETTSTGFFEGSFSRVYAKLMQLFVNPRFPKNGFDICMFSDKVRTALNQNIENNSSIFLQILNLGFRQELISYQKKERKLGKTKWTLGKKIKLFIDSFVAFSYAPIRFVTIMGSSFFFLGLFWTIYIIARQVIVGNLSPGWPALISILLIGFGITNISLGIISEYLWRTLDSSRGRPVFLIDEIIDLGGD